MKTDKLYDEDDEIAELIKRSSDVDDFFRYDVDKETELGWKYQGLVVALDDTSFALDNMADKISKRESILDSRVKCLETILKRIGNIALDNIGTDAGTRTFTLVQQGIGEPTLRYKEVSDAKT